MSLDERAEKLQEELNLSENDIKKGNEIIEALSKRLDRYKKLKDLGESFNAKLSLDDISITYLNFIFPYDLRGISPRKRFADSHKALSMFALH